MYIALIILCGLYLHLWAYLSKLEIEKKILRKMLLDATNGLLQLYDKCENLESDLKRVRAEVDQHTNPHNI